MAWQILLSRGTPPKLVALIKDLHTHHSAIIRSELDSAPVDTSVGFMQGCVLAPPLFNVCLDTVVRQLLPELQKLGVIICYKIDGQIMHCKNLTEEALMWILLYADDISSVFDTAVKLREAATFLPGGLQSVQNIPKCWLSAGMLQPKLQTQSSRCAGNNWKWCLCSGTWAAFSPLTAL